MILFVALALTGAYLITGCWWARFLFARWRPYTEPLSCRMSYSEFHTHSRSCYARSEYGLETDLAATWAALGCALIWPLTGLIIAARRFTFRVKPTHAEVEAKTDRLEKELGL